MPVTDSFVVRLFGSIMLVMTHTYQLQPPPLLLLLPLPPPRIIGSVKPTSEKSSNTTALK